MLIPKNRFVKIAKYTDIGRQNSEVLNEHVNNKIEVKLETNLPCHQVRLFV